MRQRRNDWWESGEFFFGDVEGRERGGFWRWAVGTAGLEDALEGVSDGDHDSGAEAFGGDEEDEEADARPEDDTAVEDDDLETGDGFAGDMGADEVEEFGVAVDNAGDGEIMGEILPGEEHEGEEDGPDEAAGNLGDAGGLRDQHYEQRDEQDDRLAGDGDHGGELRHGDQHGVGGVPLVANVEAAALFRAGEFEVFGGGAHGSCGNVGGGGGSERGRDGGEARFHVSVRLVGPVHEGEADKLPDDAGEEEKSEPAAGIPEGAQGDTVVAVGMDG